ncbi:DUF47 family protein [Desulfovibrio subterraneus]|jgi:hypothetical protein|uniref:Phosphate transport regulator n=1 Tax=Desulfovibrio subterraneus TaxID=2718620 RepID=A0A7J0BI34_9BACT|nr:DUF47 family protein [Desulfovibrio subterraneus]WBF67418.1 DUF47 family protein [Desulfovibrio subterraneus]GFM33228.1 hypothetical protein DSM101010T_15930 [Desulfovibrio subterraneus]
MSYGGILRKKIGIEHKVDAFLDLVSESGIIYKRGIDSYTSHNLDAFKGHLENMVETERQADVLRRSIEDLLYRRTLIPESRGDVLRLIEGMDSLLGHFKGSMFRFEIERPNMRETLVKDLLALVECVVEAVEAVTCSIRSFFKNILAVSDHLHKVSYWEAEADKISTRLQTAIFRTENLELCESLQLSAFVRHVDAIADQAEDMADSLAIYVLKRAF